MSFSEIILMNVGIAALLAAILAFVMLIPARLNAQHEAIGRERRRKIESSRAATRQRHPQGVRGRGMRPIRDEG
jgi:hypothetical protein